MQYVIDISEMSLEDLFKLRVQALLGILNMDEEDFLTLSSYIQLRSESVTMLESLLSNTNKG
jgi:hypothetical protein